MFCPKCGKGAQTPETYCRQCGILLPDVEALEKRKTSPEDHFKANITLHVMTAVVSATLAVLLHVTFTVKENAPVLIYVTAGFLTAIFFWQVQALWRTTQLKKELLKRRKQAELQARAPDTTLFIESDETKELLEEPGIRNSVLSDRAGQSDRRPSQAKRSID